MKLSASKVQDPHDILYKTHIDIMKCKTCFFLSHLWDDFYESNLACNFESKYNTYHNTAT